jgi:hypothetical protein
MRFDYKKKAVETTKQKGARRKRAPKAQADVVCDSMLLMSFAVRAAPPPSCEECIAVMSRLGIT